MKGKPWKGICPVCGTKFSILDYTSEEIMEHIGASIRCSNINCNARLILQNDLSCITSSSKKEYDENDKQNDCKKEE